MSEECKFFDKLDAILGRQPVHQSLLDQHTLSDWDPPNTPKVLPRNSSTDEDRAGPSRKEDSTNKAEEKTPQLPGMKRKRAAKTTKMEKALGTVIDRFVDRQHETEDICS